MEEDRKLYSPNSAARALDISRSKVYDLMKSGALHFVLIGADRRIPADEIQRIASDGAAPAKSARLTCAPTAHEPCAVP